MNAPLLPITKAENATKLRAFAWVSMALALAVVGIGGQSFGARCAAPVNADSAITWLESSMIPKIGPKMQRSAPATWSSRSNVRWEARWGSESRYMV